MKKRLLTAAIISIALTSVGQTARLNATNTATGKTAAKTTSDKLYMDVHDLQPGKVNFAAVLAAHQKDLATEGKYGVSFIKFWVDEKKGKVYCLSTSKDTQSIRQTHAEAHGLLPTVIYEVSDGKKADTIKGEKFFLDVHQLGAGKVTAAAVAAAHAKDLAVQKKYGVNFINYWVDEKVGTIFCLSQAPDSNAVIRTHKDAHGLLPAYVLEVKQGE
ncbi:MAG: DUF4242 domain-containing protein [Ferruginibacter sp.]